MPTPTFAAVFVALATLSVVGAPPASAQVAPPGSPAPTAAATSAPAPAADLLAKAKTAAGKQGKRVFVRFTASWCGWCHKMEKILDDPQVAAVVGRHFVLVTLDVLEQGPKKALENPGAEAIMNALGGAGQGIPYFAAISPKGEKLLDSRQMPGNQNIGCPATPEEIAAFGVFLAKTAPRMTPQEIKVVVDAFTAAAVKR
jgi:hypothetical protein